MVGVFLEGIGYGFEEFFFDFKRCFPRGKAGAVRDPEDVRIYSNSGRAKGGIEHHIGGFSANARKAF